MKKVLKTIGKILLIILAALILFLLILFIYHRIMLSKEKKLLEPFDGVQMVEVDGHKMSIYTEGEGEHTIVFMSGSGTVSPILDFKPLYSKLSNDYKIVVIEKFGYGFSDTVDTERSFETILRQDREALEKAGIEGPYILCPHSMSGIEAMLWEIEHPEEVEAIIGLDMGYPKEYLEWEDMNVESQYKLARLLNNMGVYRLVLALSGDETFDAFKTGVLTEKEKDIYKAILYARILNKTVQNETIENAQIVSKKITENPKPDIPMLIFTSLGDGDPNDKEAVEKWRGYAIDYTSDMPNAKLVKLDCGHYIHNIETDTIEKEMREFIKKLDDSKNN